MLSTQTKAPVPHDVFSSSSKHGEKATSLKTEAPEGDNMSSGPVQGESMGGNGRKSRPVVQRGTGVKLRR
jgi:hypothetical protein